VRLLDRGRPERIAVLPPLAFALMETGEFGPLQPVVAEIEPARGGGEDGMRARARVLRLWIWLFMYPVNCAEAAEAGRLSGPPPSSETIGGLPRNHHCSTSSAP